jgi:hypothetical protein
MVQAGVVCGLVAGLFDIVEDPFVDGYFACMAIVSVISLQHLESTRGRNRSLNKRLVECSAYQLLHETHSEASLREQSQMFELFPTFSLHTNRYWLRAAAVQN